jgi:L-glutamine:2-deoxy-scyllo-inosose/3-amino-2,3-dideoxy-scyllo-inosose aminotransferase
VKQVTTLALHGGSPVREKPFPRWPVHDDAERRMLLEVLDSGEWAYEGPKEAAFAQRFASECDSRYAFAVTSGTTALETAIRGLGIGPGDEVIVPALTWTAPAMAVVLAGARVVFADVRRSDWCLDPGSVTDLISPRTKALLIVHTYGQAAPVEELLDIADRHGLRVLEDCAHAVGGRWRDRALGSLGDVGVFSFQLGKGMTCGEGGALVTDDTGLADRIYALKNCGRRRTEDLAFGFGGNLRITEFQAAILLAQLGRLDEQMRHRRATFQYFADQAAAMTGINPLLAKPEVTRWGAAFGFSVAYDPAAFNGLPVARLVDALNAEGIPARRPHQVVYHAPYWTAALQEAYWRLGDDPERTLGLNAHCPVAEAISDDVGFVLPHRVFLGDTMDVDDVVIALDKIRSHSWRWESE